MPLQSALDYDTYNLSFVAIKFKQFSKDCNPYAYYLNKTIKCLPLRSKNKFRMSGYILNIQVWGGERAPQTVWSKMAARSRKSCIVFCLANANEGQLTQLVQCMSIYPQIFLRNVTIIYVFLLFIKILGIMLVTSQTCCKMSFR